MANYSKLFGSLIGGAVGLMAAFGLPVDWLTPEVQATFATLLGSAFGTFLAPANKTA